MEGLESMCAEPLGKLLLGQWIARARNYGDLPKTELQTSLLQIGLSVVSPGFDLLMRNTELYLVLREYWLRSIVTPADALRAESSLRLGMYVKDNPKATDQQLTEAIERELQFMADSLRGSPKQKRIGTRLPRTPRERNFHPRASVRNQLESNTTTVAVRQPKR